MICWIVWCGCCGRKECQQALCPRMTIRAWPRARVITERPGPFTTPAIPVPHSHSVSIVRLFVQYKHFGWLYVITQPSTSAWTSTLTHKRTHTHTHTLTVSRTRGLAQTRTQLTSGILFHACLPSNMANEKKSGTRSLPRSSPNKHPH